MSSDTHPQAEHVLIERTRQVPAWRKVQMVGQMWQTMRALALAGGRARHPGANPSEEYSEMSQPITVTLCVIDVLEQLDIPYLLGGSFASAIHGTARATMDADIVAQMQPTHVTPLTEALGEAFYPKPRLYSRAQFARRERCALMPDSTRTVYVASAEDIILAKLEWGKGTSDRQWEDVQGVLKIQAGRLDLDYLHRWAGELGVGDLLARALDAAGL